MSVTRTAIRLLGLGAALLGGCEAYPTLKNLPTDCSIESAYQFEPRPIDLSTAFSFGDPTAGATAGATVGPIPDGALCGAATALDITSHHHNDWGSAVGFYGFTGGNTYRDESAYEGMSFWARSPGATTKGFTIQLSDANTFSAAPDAGSNCIDYSDGGTTVTYTVNANGVITGVSGSTPPDSCGNDYTTAMAVTQDWRFYTIPFTELFQSAMASRVPNGVFPGTGLLTDKLMGLVLRMPKEAEMNLWIAKMGFYRKNDSPAPTDAGAD